METVLASPENKSIIPTTPQRSKAYSTHSANSAHGDTAQPLIYHRSSQSTSSAMTTTPLVSGGNRDLLLQSKSSSAILQQLQRLPAWKQAGGAMDIDLEGGTLLSVEESEELDPEDNCRVQVTTYNILSADGTEESTITKRRKLKVNCTQSLKRVEFLNGKEAKYEEKTTVFDNVDALGALPAGVGVPDGSEPSTQLVLDHSDPQDMAIGEVLSRTQDTFLSLLNEKKEQLVKMFPELFSDLRSQPAIFESVPSTVMETVVNADGTTTTRTRSSKAFSSHYTRQETYLNGVRQESRSKFRAFMEYAGPEGGFSIRLNNAADDDLSESEDATTGGGGDGTSNSDMDRLSRSGLSEIPDTVSALVSSVSGSHNNLSGVPNLLCVESAPAIKRRDKAWHAVNELVESEGRYVQKLALLEHFREEVEKQRLFDKKQLALIFANISSLYRFHNDHLLPQLMDRRREWQSSRKISDVLRKQAPFLKMYSEYTNNYKRSVATFDACLRKKRHFDELVRHFESLPECDNLPLVSHLICPVQRVMRYQLLLKEYQKHLHEKDEDYLDTDAALSLVVEAASHANEMMRKLDRYRNVIEVQEQLGNVVSLVSPSRELLTRARLTKISSSTNKAEERVLFVFNDLFLLASERLGLLGGGGAKYKLRAIFDASRTQICEGDNLEREHSFYLRGADTPNGPSRCVELICSSGEEKAKLLETIWTQIEEAHNRRESVSAPLTPTLHQLPSDRKCCSQCDLEFNWFTLGRSQQCTTCQQRFCKACFFIATAKKSKICGACQAQLKSPPGTEQGEGRTSKRNLLATPARSSDQIKASYVRFRGAATPGTKYTERFFVLRKNFCLYSYKSEEDSCALAMLPLAGCDIEQSTTDGLSFSIRHANRLYHILCTNESDHAEWMAALILSANAKLPAEPVASNLALVPGAIISRNGEYPPGRRRSSTGNGTASSGRQRNGRVAHVHESGGKDEFTHI